MIRRLGVFLWTLGATLISVALVVNSQAKHLDASVIASCAVMATLCWVIDLAYLLWPEAKP